MKPEKIKAGEYRYRGFTIEKRRTSSDFKTGRSSTYWGSRAGSVFASTLREATEQVDRWIETKERAEADGLEWDHRLGWVRRKS